MSFVCAYVNMQCIDLHLFHICHQTTHSAANNIICIFLFYIIIFSFSICLISVLFLTRSCRRLLLINMMAHMVCCAFKNNGRHCCFSPLQFTVSHFMPQCCCQVYFVAFTFIFAVKPFEHTDCVHIMCMCLPRVVCSFQYGFNCVIYGAVLLLLALFVERCVRVFKKISKSGKECVSLL